MLEFAVVCYNFQKRFSWQLSSLLEQIDPPDSLINVAYVKNNGTPKTEDIIDYYKSKGLQFNETVFDTRDKMPNHRGLIRDYQVHQSKGDYIFFADCDVVYSKDFLNKLVSLIPPEFSGVTSCARLKVTDLETTEKMILTSSIYTPEAYSIADSISGTRSRKCGVAIGGMQVVKRESIYKFRGGNYASKRKMYDGVIGNIGTYSDIQFRCAIASGSKQDSNMIKLPIQIHLNHYRSYNEHYNIEYQR